MEVYEDKYICIYTYIYTRERCLSPLLSLLYASSFSLPSYLITNITNTDIIIASIITIDTNLLSISILTTTIIIRNANFILFLLLPLLLLLILLLL